MKRDWFMDNKNRNKWQSASRVGGSKVIPEHFLMTFLVCDVSCSVCYVIVT